MTVDSPPYYTIGYLQTILAMRRALWQWHGVPEESWNYCEGECPDVAWWCCYGQQSLAYDYYSWDDSDILIWNIIVLQAKINLIAE